MKRNGNWIWFVAGRFGNADSRGRSALTSMLAALGIAFGVLALIVILSVMNGFQMGYIESILEVSSAHVRVTGAESDIAHIGALPGVRTVSVFTESQTLMQGAYGSQQGALVRAVNPRIRDTDEGFARSAKIVEGSFDLSRPRTIVLGCELARMLSVGVGDTVSLLAVSGSASTDLVPADASLVVTGLLKTGYYAIDNSFSFVSRETGDRLFGHGDTVLAGVKLANSDSDREFLSRLAADFPALKAESWRSYNRAFFGALRVEKNMLLFLVILIFLVVTVNIYNSMRKSVYERREEISVLNALGSSPRDIRLVFIMNGLGIGLAGGLLGLISGLFLSVRINDVFAFAEEAVNGVNLFVAALLEIPPGQAFTLFSPEYFYMDAIPVRIQFPEVLFVFLFGSLSAAFAAWLASRAITKLKPAEVLRYE
jgi:ABC-type transport system, involved in lipoprotein release, permease component